MLLETEYAHAVRMRYPRPLSPGRITCSVWSQIPPGTAPAQYASTWIPAQRLLGILALGYRPQAPLQVSRNTNAINTPAHLSPRSYPCATPLPSLSLALTDGFPHIPQSSLLPRSLCLDCPSLCAVQKRWSVWVVGWEGREGRRQLPALTSELCFWNSQCGCSRFNW